MNADYTIKDEFTSTTHHAFHHNIKEVLQGMFQDAPEEVQVTAAELAQLAQSTSQPLQEHEAALGIKVTRN